MEKMRVIKNKVARLVLNGVVKILESWKTAFAPIFSIIVQISYS